MKTLTDLRKLRHVVQVAHAGSFTGAASALAITQSALTKSVAEVEQLLGIRLFQRLPRGVELTEAGALFVPRAERILTDANDLMQQLGDLQSMSRGHLRIGVAPAAYISFLESTVGAFARVYPGIHIDIRDGSIDAMAQAAMNGQVDLVIGGVNYLRSWRELEITEISELHQFVIARPDHPLTRMPAAGAAEILGFPLILPAAGLTTDAQLANAYVAAGLSPTPPQYTCDHFPLVKKLVTVTDAVSPVVSLAPASERFRDEFVVFEGVIDFGDPALGIAVARNREMQAAARAFIDIFGSFLQDPDV